MVLVKPNNLMEHGLFSDVFIQMKYRYQISVPITDLRYADDIAILLESALDLQIMVEFTYNIQREVHVHI